LWVHALFIYLLQDSSWYVAGVSLSSALDLWRHSIFTPKPTSLIYRCLSPWLILPRIMLGITPAAVLLEIMEQISSFGIKCTVLILNATKYQIL
jgi:hypothetical protein